ncbi:MAG: tRNA lysidine(34) synthetase TilS [Lentisphaeria bacterium]|nr:tRNA lysidine(34) synthetase TilS [Lentisphaeria bacterium]
MPNLTQQFKTALQTCGVTSDQPLIVGFSGGMDSLALVLLLQTCGQPCAATHLNHGLRGPAADADADWCRQVCDDRGIPFERACLEVADARRAGESLEEAARRRRLEFWRNNHPGATIALAHHADDALEDFFLRLARGSNSGGLTGLRPVRDVEGVHIIRPLLSFRKAELKNWLAEKGVTEWCEDLSNADVRHRRNAVRHEWLPAIRKTLGGDQALFHTLDVLRQDADFLEQAAESAVPADDSVEAFRRLHPALFPRVLRLWIRKKTGFDWLPSQAAVARLQEELATAGESVKYAPLGDGLKLAVEQGTLRIARNMLAYNLDWPWTAQPRLEIPGTDLVLEATRVAAAALSETDLRSPRNDRACFPADDLPAVLHIKNWEPGDRMVPFGHHSERKLKDIFSQAGIAADRRPDFPVMRAGDEVLWIAGIKRSALSPVKKDTGDLVVFRRVRKSIPQ